MRQEGLPFEAARPPVPKVGLVASGQEPASALYFVRHPRARRYLLRVEPTGRIRVTIPRGGSKREAESFVRRQQAWILHQMQRLASSTPIPSADRGLLLARARLELPSELLATADRLGLIVTKVSVRNQRSRWGSCGRDGHITLNWRLVTMPSWVREYVLIHELIHLKRMDHSPAYWALVAEACPDYAKARQWLRAHGRGLA